MSLSSVEPERICLIPILKKWASGFILLVLLLCVAFYAEAGIVYGHIFDLTKTFQPGDEITISGRDANENNISIRAITDAKEGGRIISLPPGVYAVEFRKNKGLSRAESEVSPSQGKDQ